MWSVLASECDLTTFLHVRKEWGTLKKSHSVWPPSSLLSFGHCTWHGIPQTSLVAQTVKNLPAMWETQVQSLGREDPLVKGMATHPSILAWGHSMEEEPGRQQSVGSQRVRHD